MTEHDLRLRDGRTLHVYDSGPGAKNNRPSDTELVVFWHHGTPGLGAPPEPFATKSDQLGIRWVSFDRPGYGGSTRLRGRTVASVAADVAEVADALGIERFAAMGASGGGPHSLGCAAVLPDRVTAVVSIAGLAPISADGLDWFAGMAAAGAAELHAASAGPDRLKGHLLSTDFDPEIFTAADHAELAGAWSWLGRISGQGMQGGIDGMVDDDLAYVTPWGFAPTDVHAPVLLVHGDDDRVVPSTHSGWLANHLPAAELWRRPGAGHISVLTNGEDALDWLTRSAAQD